MIHLPHQLHRDNQRDRTTNAMEINIQSKGVNTCLGTTCHRVSVICGKLIPDGYLLFTPYFHLLISTAFVVVSRVGCLEVTCMFTSFLTIVHSHPQSDNGRLWAMEPRLLLKRFSPWAGLELRATRSACQHLTSWATGARITLVRMK